MHTHVIVCFKGKEVLMEDKSDQMIARDNEIAVLKRIA